MGNSNMWIIARRATLGAMVAAMPVANGAAQIPQCLWELDVDGRHYAGSAFGIPGIFFNDLCASNIREDSSNLLWKAGIRGCYTLRNFESTHWEFSKVIAAVHEHWRDFPAVCGMTATPLNPDTLKYSGMSTNFRYLPPGLPMPAAK
jgi:hypothetical protein